MSKGPFKLRSGNTTAFKSMGSSPAKQSIKDLYNKGVEGIKNVGDKIINTDIKDIPVTLVPGSPSYNDIKNLLTPEKKTGNAGKKIADAAKKILEKTKKKQAKKVDKELPGFSPVKPKKPNKPNKPKKKPRDPNAHTKVEDKLKNEIVDYKDDMKKKKEKDLNSNTPKNKTEKKKKEKGMTKEETENMPKGA